MKHRIDVFSPETYQWFSASDRQLAGVKARYRMLASEVAPGDLLIGYVTRLSRWCGVLEVTGKAFEDSAPRFSDGDDPYILRFRVKPLVWLSIEQSIPVHEDFVWNALSFTQNHSKTSSLWTGPLRTSLTALGANDGAFLVKTLRQQAESLRSFPLDPRAQRIIRGYRVNRADGAVSVTVPDDLEDGADASEAPGSDVRESVKIQALLVRIGAAMHMRVWIPANDRAAVVRELGNDDAALLDNLPLNYDSTTIDTIERIDVLWIKGLYPSPSEPAALERLAPELAMRLRSLSHEMRAAGRRRVGFLPVSPWDIGSVERMARQLRWVTTAPTFVAYPPTIVRPELSDLSRWPTWLEAVGNTLRVLRAPLENESLHADRLLSEATKRLKQLEDERVDVSLQGREAVREGARTRNINARKKELHAEITDAEQRLEVLRRFQRDLASAVGVVGDLLRCPTCNTRADARGHFKPMGQHFSCACSDCSTTWGTIACGRCSGSIPVLRLAGTDWMKQPDTPGWVDRTLGADVLAIPWSDGANVGFTCTHCGDARGVSPVQSISASAAPLD